MTALEKKLIEAMAEEIENCYGRETELSEKAREYLERSAEDCGGGWISCRDRLPEKDGFYLATIDGEIAGEDKPFSGLAEFENGKWIDDEDGYQYILAWQPLPEPYHP